MVHFCKIGLVRQGLCNGKIINEETSPTINTLIGLGHMAVMIAKAMGADVTAITSKEEKREPAMEFGASDVLISENEEELKAVKRKFDFILFMIAVPFDI